MKHLLQLTALTENEILKIFDLADHAADYRGTLNGKAVALFFPPASVLTRVTFELAVRGLGGETVSLPSDALDKKGGVADTLRYLGNWLSAFVVRHKNIALLKELAENSSVPIINAMTNMNHPCEILSDLYALSKRRADWRSLNYLFVGVPGNIGLAWKEAAEALGLRFLHACPDGYEMSGVRAVHDMASAIRDVDIVLTDSLPSASVTDFAPYQITVEQLQTAHRNVLLNPCPPFYRGEEISADAIDSEHFVGYDFKRSLVQVQQAVLLWCMEPHTGART